MKIRGSIGLPLLSFLAISILLYHGYVLYNSKLTENNNGQHRVSKELTIICTNGRLGNKMFMYAVLYGLAKTNNRIPVPPSCVTKEMNDVFEYTLKTPSQLSQKDWVGHDIGRYLNKPADLRILPEVNIITGNQYAASYTFFYDVASEIRREFTFTKKYREHGDKILREAKGKRKEATFVGVHVRRTDYLLLLKRYNIREVTKDFFQKAFQFFRSRYSNCVFVVTSDEISWCKQNLNASDLFFQDKFVSAGIDLVVLARCNHSIFDYGTFGFWGSFLAGGETVYPAYLTHPRFNPENALYQRFFLPEWVSDSEISYKVMQKQKEHQTT